MTQPEAAPSIETLLGPAGPLASAHPRYEARDAQSEMAAAVERTIRDGGVLVVEAGTGTGKTLAYLLPAVRCGRRVVISTGTKALQEQLVQKDLPLLRDAFGLEFEAAVMKGRQNYLCLHRFREFSQAPSFERRDEAPLFPRVRLWAGRTETGDLAEVPELPEELAFWRDINAKADTCLGRRCEDFDACWLTRMRERAQRARIVIVNHHLLLADLALRESAYGSVLPDYDVLIVDEAHRIEDVATQAFAVSVSTWRMKELTGDAARSLHAAGARPRGASRLLSEIDAACRRLFALLPEREGRARLDERLLGEAGLRALEDRGAAVGSLLGGLAASLRGAEATGVAREGLEAVARRCETIASELREIVLREDPGRVHWAEIRPGGALLLSSPVDVSDLLRSALFEPLAATVLTSATLAVGGTTAFFRGRVGIPDAEERVLPSPFSWEKQALLYLPGDLPDPRDPGFAECAGERMAELVARSRGRAFLLFTSYQNLHAVEAVLRERDLPWPLLVQGEAPKHALLERFQREGNAVLLATSSFWEGVDVPGEALSLVAVDKIPFAVPTDPIVAARAEKIERDGGNPFREYQIPEAILALKQGLGRLIRSREDRGVLAVLDPRVRRSSYGPLVLASLPPCRRTSSLEDVAAFFATP